VDLIYKELFYVVFTKLLPLRILCGRNMNGLKNLVWDDENTNNNNN